jgi:hypothetical protein
MIDQNGDDYTIFCDACSTGTAQIDAIDWHDMIRQLKEKGWKITKEGATWEHTCPNCVGKEAKKEFTAV